MVSVKKVYYVAAGPTRPSPTVSIISSPSWTAVKDTGLENNVAVVSVKPSSEVQVGPDSCLSWVVAAACFMYTFVTIGLGKTNSVIFVEYLKVTGLSREVASWPFSVAGLSIIVVGPLIGVATRHISPRYISLLGAVTFFGGTLSGYFTLNIYYMIIFFGAVRGIGVATAVVLTPAFINQYFRRHRATAQGIVGAGTSVGVLVFLLAVTHGVEVYALRGTLLILAGVSLNAVAASWLLNSPPWLQKKKNIEKTPKVQIHDNPSFVPDSTKCAPVPDVVQSINQHPPEAQITKKKANVLRELLSILINPMFLLITFTYSMVVNAGLTLNMIIVDYAQDLGIPVEESVYIILAFSAGEFVGKIGLGWVTDKKFLSLQGYFAVASFISGGIHFGIPFLNSPSIGLLASAFGVCGVLQGSTQSYVTLFFDEYLKNKDNVQLALSLFLPGVALLALARSPLIGVFRDGMGSYDNLFRLIGLTLFLAASIWTVERIWTHLRRRRSK